MSDRQLGLTSNRTAMLREVERGVVATRAGGVYWYVENRPAGRQHGRALRELLAAGLVELVEESGPDNHGDVTRVTLSDDGRARLRRSTRATTPVTSTDAPDDPA